MMSERVRMEIERFRREHRGDEHEWDVWESIFRDYDISSSSFHRYMRAGVIEFVEHVYSFEEIYGVDVDLDDFDYEFEPYEQYHYYELI